MRWIRPTIQIADQNGERAERRDQARELLVDGGGRDDVRVVGTGNLWRRADRHHHGVWLWMGSVAGATWIVNRWNRWWVWGSVSVVLVILAAAALEFVAIVEEF